jgi:hypothetical protein
MATPQNPIEDLKRKMGYLPAWVYWSIAVFGAFALVIFVVYAYYLKKKGATA